MRVCSAIVLVARVDSGMVRLILWDLGGQEDLQTLWDKVCTGTMHAKRQCLFTSTRFFFHFKWMYFCARCVSSFGYRLFCIMLAVLF